MVHLGCKYEMEEIRSDGVAKLLSILLTGLPREHIRNVKKLRVVTPTSG